SLAVPCACARRRGRWRGPSAARTGRRPRAAAGRAAPARDDQLTYTRAETSRSPRGARGLMRKCRRLAQLRLLEEIGPVVACFTAGESAVPTHTDRGPGAVTHACLDVLQYWKARPEGRSPPPPRTSNWCRACSATASRDPG